MMTTTLVTGGNTHAWVQVYVPGPGWIDFDPSSGMVGNENLVRVAVVREPCEAIPLQGTWIGTTSDHLAHESRGQGHRGAGRRSRMRRAHRHEDDDAGLRRLRLPMFGRRRSSNGTFLPSYSLQISGKAPLARAEEVFDEDSCGLRDFL